MNVYTVLKSKSSMVVYLNRGRVGKVELVDHTDDAQQDGTIDPRQSIRILELKSSYVKR